MIFYKEHVLIVYLFQLRCVRALAETTADDFDEQRYKTFQQRLGVFGKGLWRREWSLYLSPFGKYQVTKLFMYSGNSFKTTSKRTALPCPF